MDWQHRKCERHVHFGGSISPDTVWAIIEMNRSYHIADSLEAVRTRMICLPGEFGFTTFLRKFSILDEITWDSHGVDLACQQICRDIHKQGIECVDISFSIDKYVRSGLWDHVDAICFICERLKHYGDEFRIEIGPFLSLSYHSNRGLQEVVGDLIFNSQVRNRVAGLDLVGDEEFYSAWFYGPIIEKWNREGKITRAHLAEMPGTSDNLALALYLPETQRPVRIAHGIQGQTDILKRAADLGIYFDLAINSNLATGAISRIESHPLPKMLEAGCLVTLNTDDPVQFGCILDDEYNMAINAGLIDRSQAYKIQENATIR